MSDSGRPGASTPASSPLPDAPSLDWLRKEAKRRLLRLRESNPGAKLADAQLDLARQYGFPSWRALKGHIDSLTIDGQLFDAAQTGNIERLRALLDAHPAGLEARMPPYGHTLLHIAAFAGHLPIVDLLLARGLDPNVREQGDDTYPMHWAAAAGHLDIVRRLADAGGDVVGAGDDHQLGVIGWATSWDGCDDDAHRAIADLLVSRGAEHHIFSAIAMNLAGEVRRIVARDPSALGRRMSRNENHQLPLHFAVRMNRPGMVALLLELGADPAATDDSGNTVAMYAASPNVGRGVIEVLAARDGGGIGFFAALALHDWGTAERLVNERTASLAPGGAHFGMLHLMAKRGDVRAVKWLLAHGADPSACWPHWDADVTPLHLAIFGDHAAIVRVLLHAGADPAIRDTKHDADAMGWADFFRRGKIIELLNSSRGAS